MNAAPSTALNTFAGLELERAAERRDDADWLHRLEAAPDTRFLLLDAATRLLVPADADAPLWLDAAQREQLLPEVPASLLGLADGRGHFLLHLDDDRADTAAAALGAQRLSLREAGTRFTAFDAGLYAYASGLAHWQARTCFCPQCGGALERQSAGHRACCTACGALQFPRSDPAIIVIVEHDGACLLGRQANWPAHRYSTLAGFVEPGESLEDAVRREVFEEAGVEVDTCDYHSSQPWPFPASLMLGFTARARTRDIHLRDGELEHAAWFTPQQIVESMHAGRLLSPSRLSVSWRLIEHWLRARAGIELSELCAAARHASRGH